MSPSPTGLSSRADISRCIFQQMQQVQVLLVPLMSCFFPPSGDCLSNALLSGHRLIKELALGFKKRDSLSGRVFHSWWVLLATLTTCRPGFLLIEQRHMGCSFSLKYLFSFFSWGANKDRFYLSAKPTSKTEVL